MAQVVVKVEPVEEEAERPTDAWQHSGGFYELPVEFQTPENESTKTKERIKPDQRGSDLSSKKNYAPKNQTNAEKPQTSAVENNVGVDLKMEKVWVKTEPADAEDEEWAPDAVKQELDIGLTQSCGPSRVKSEPAEDGHRSQIQVSITRMSSAENSRDAETCSQSSLDQVEHKRDEHNRNVTALTSDESQNITAEKCETDSGNHQFETCNNELNNKNTLLAHLLTQDKKPELKFKIVKQTGERPYECAICKKRFRQYGHLSSHLRSHTGERPYECPICKNRFAKTGNLSTHMMIHTGEKPFECSICNRRFIQSCDLIKHKRIHTGEKPYECSVCNKRFFNSSDLKTHSRIHTGEKPYECSICQKRFNHISSLKNHTRYHSGTKAYECVDCNKRFFTNSNLKKHVKIHTGKKPYECTICDSRFTHKGTLTSHLKYHIGAKSHECLVCNKKFINNGDLKKHSRIHTGEKPYECSLCNKRFLQSGHLTRHSKIHTSEKPYKCFNCNKEFTEKGSLKKHMKIHAAEISTDKNNPEDLLEVKVQ